MEERRINSRDYYNFSVHLLNKDVIRYYKSFEEFEEKFVVIYEAGKGLVNRVPYTSISFIDYELPKDK